LTFICGSTCFGSFLANHQELTTALAASGFTVGTWRLLVVVWQVDNLPDHDQQRSSRFSPKVKPEAPSAVVWS